ncbi:MAG: HD domain-containing protein [Erysipelotrichaceae bacterium]
MEKMSKMKVLRDPIHDYIHVDLQVVWDCINAKEFQRLRRIKQLGGAFQVYHTAEHTRFGHSLGVYEIVKRMVDEVEEIDEALSSYEKKVVMLAGLLHDLGHFPFSHAFESVSGIKHEVYTVKIIEGNSEIHDILAKEHEDLVRDVVQVIKKNHPRKLMNQMISSQMDADRMDYLLRDAYFTGTKYGIYDLERILRTMRVKNDEIVIKESGIHGVEDYIMARYHMYWQVYFHPTCRSYEAMLSLLFKRLKDVCIENPAFIKQAEMFQFILLEEEMNVGQHYYFDEASCLYGFSCLSQSDDAILKYLADSLMNRKLFAYCDLTSEQEFVQKQDALNKHGFDARYFLNKDNATQRPYNPYSLNMNDGVMILMKDERILELSQASVIVEGLMSAKQKHDPKMFYIKENGYK